MGTKSKLSVISIVLSAVALIFLFQNCGTAKSSGNLQNGSGIISGEDPTEPTTDFTPQDPSFAKSISSGQHHACRIKNDASVECWGENQYGQLGQGGPVDSDRSEFVGNSTVPLAVSGLPPVKFLDSGNYYTCAITLDGDLYCWGHNFNGQLETAVPSDKTDPSNYVPKSSPTKVDLPEKVKVVSGGRSSTCAISITDKLYCWGSNHNGQLGNGESGDNRAALVEVSLPAKPVQVVVYTIATCAVLDDHSLWCWGQNTNGHFGAGGDSLTPKQITAVSDVRAVAMGSYHTCALTGDGSVYCWGDTAPLAMGQLGVANQVTSAEPLKVPLPNRAIAIDSMSYHTCVRSEDGEIYCWGENNHEQIAFPDQAGLIVSEPVAIGYGNLVKQFSLGSYHTCIESYEGDHICYGRTYGDRSASGAGEGKGMWGAKKSQDVLDFLDI